MFSFNNIFTNTTIEPIVNETFGPMVNETFGPMVNETNGTFVNKNFGTKNIDAWPSDAISIALRLNAQIYVTKQVIKEAGVDKNEIVSDNKQTIIPKYSLQDLEFKLKQAVDEEEYEKAAKIRDKIKELES